MMDKAQSAIYTSFFLSLGRLGKSPLSSTILKYNNVEVHLTSIAGRIHKTTPHRHRVAQMLAVLQQPTTFKPVVLIPWISGMLFAAN